jgi:hypothetical protein
MNRLAGKAFGFTGGHQQLSMELHRTPEGLWWHPLGWQTMLISQLTPLILLTPQIMIFPHPRLKEIDGFSTDIGRQDNGTRMQRTLYRKTIFKLLNSRLDVFEDHLRQVRTGWSIDFWFRLHNIGLFARGIFSEWAFSFPVADLATCFAVSAADAS